MLPAFLTTILFSLSAVCGHRTSRLVGGTEANFWRLVFAALLLAAFAHTWGGGLANAALPVFFISGCVGFGVGDAAFFQALPRIGSRLSAMMVLCLSSPLAAVIEWLWLGTRLSLAEILCGVITLGGVAVALAPGPHSPPGGPRLTAGILFGLLATACQAGGAVLSRKAFEVARLAADPIDGITAAYQRILGGIIVMALLLLLVKRRFLVQMLLADEDEPPVDLTARKANWRKAWPWVLLNGLVGPALGVSCFQWALMSAPTGIVLPIIATTPIVIIPFAHYLEGERPTRRSLAGGAIAVLGAGLLAWISQPG
jgi:drug/metabolite transporter (DMT)-like permease